MKTGVYEDTSILSYHNKKEGVQKVRLGPGSGESARCNLGQKSANKVGQSW